MEHDLLKKALFTALTLFTVHLFTIQAHADIVDFPPSVKETVPPTTYAAIAVVVVVAAVLVRKLFKKK